MDKMKDSRDCWHAGRALVAVLAVASGIVVGSKIYAVYEQPLSGLDTRSTYRWLYISLPGTLRVPVVICTRRCVLLRCAAVTPKLFPSTVPCQIQQNSFGTLLLHSVTLLLLRYQTPAHLTRTWTILVVELDRVFWAWQKIAALDELSHIASPLWSTVSCPSPPFHFLPRLSVGSVGSRLLRESGAHSKSTRRRWAKAAVGLADMDAALMTLKITVAELATFGRHSLFRGHLIVGELCVN